MTPIADASMKKKAEYHAWLERITATPGIFWNAKLVSETNDRDRWGRIKRTKKNRGNAKLWVGAWLRQNPQPAGILCITITRYGMRLMDDDNLAASAKGVRDGIADAFSSDDSAKSRLRFFYEQEATRRKGWHGVRIAIVPWVEQLKSLAAKLEQENKALTERASDGKL